MEKTLGHSMDKFRSEGMNFQSVHELIEILKKEGSELDRNDLIDLLRNNRFLNLHITPNNLAQIISDFAKLFRPESAIDICCGIGNILYYLQNQIDDLTGVEVLPNVAAISDYLMPDVKVITADTFNYPFARKYDLVVGNLPWGLKMKLGEKFVGGEAEFIRKAFSICSENGNIIVVVPYSFLIGGQFEKFRSELVSSNKLEAIVSLPAGMMRSANVRTAIVIFKPKKSNDSVFISELSEERNVVEEYANPLTKKFNISEINNRWDTEYYLSNLTNVYSELDSFTTKPLQDLAEVINGKYKSPSLLTSKGELLYLKPIHLKNNAVHLSGKDMYINRDALSESERKSIAQPGDIIISTIFNDLKLHIYKKDNPPAFISNNLAIIRSGNNDYILSYLQTEEGRRIFKSQANLLVKGATIPYLTIADIREIKIPVLPTHQLNSLGNQSIATAPLSQLEQALELIKEYKSQIEKLQSKNDESVSMRAFIEDRFTRIENQIGEVKEKLDELLGILKDLGKDFDKIRSLAKTDEEKIFKLCQAMDGKLNLLLIEQNPIIENYIEEIKRWLFLWEILDEASKKFLPLAEFIFDELNRLPDADYSPFILQYCRTLENEILKKLFEAYHDNIKASEVNKEEMIVDDLGNDKTGKFAEMVKKDKKYYTLGDMNFIMSLLKEDGNTLKSSKLLQHFRHFALQYFEKRIFEKQFLADVNTITTQYRNKAAHLSVLDLATAKNCQELLRKCLNEFLECKKQRDL
jgi:hypothetical protein